jgi:hypothetical protein
MNTLLAGGIATASLIAGLFFFRFWRTTRDRFFLWFALSFLIEGINRFSLYAFAGLNDSSPIYYVIRLVAYGLIVWAILEKNMKPRGGGPR